MVDTGKTKSTEGGEETHPPLNGMVWKIPLFCFLSIFDVIATNIVSRWGTVEMNPIYLAAAESNVSLMELKLLLMSFIVFLVLWLYDHRQRDSALRIIHWAISLYFGLAMLQLWGVKWFFTGS